jgi:hypothetical protein
LLDPLQDKIDAFNQGIDKVQQRIIDLNTELGGPGSSIINNLSTAVVKARGFSEPLANASDITRELNKLQQKNEALIIRRKVAEKSYAEAIGTAAEESTLETLKKASAELQVNQMLEDQLRKLEAIADEETKITKEKEKQRSLTEQTKKLLQEKFKPFAELFTVAGILKAIVDGGNQFDKTSVSISKNIGYGASEANRMARGMQLTSVFSNATNLTMKNMTEAMGQLNEATGFVAEYSKNTLETQIMLTKQFGLTAEEAAGIYKLSVLTGKSSEKVNDEMVGAFVAARNASKVGVPFKTVMAEAAKVSGQLKANLGANPATIVKSIVQAKALGTTLEQTASQGEKLLDFSSSIESELKAELLTGKQLNLERARAAALAGDQVALAEELNKNIGSYEDFTKMNVLQQKALAESVGLTTDQLANQLEKQKLAKESGKSLAQITKEEALQAEKRKEIQQKFNDIVEKLQNLIGTVGALFAPLIQGITWLADNAWVVYSALAGWLAYSILIKNSFSGIGNTIKGIGSNVSKLFSKEGRTSLKESIIGGGDKVKETAEKTTEAGEKTGAGGPKAGEGIKNTLTGISDGIKSFREVKFSDIAKLVGASIALVLLTPAVPALLALQFVKGDLIENALTGLGKGLAALGEALSKGQVILGIVVLTGAMIGLGFALKLAAPGIEAFGKAIKFAFEGIGAIITAAANGISTIFSSLQGVDVTKLLAIGPALIGIGVGLASLGAGGVISAIGAFLGGDPIEKIERLAASGDGLQKTATALQALAGALTGISSALTALDTSKLEALNKFAATQASNSAVSGITDFITAPIKAISGAIGGEKNEIQSGIDLTPMIAAINEVKASIDKLYTKDTTINMDGKKVGTTLVQGSYKSA